jgi:hypothetical protein
MSEQTRVSLSITDQILEILFISLESQDGFTKPCIDGLRILADQQELTKPVQVESVLKSEIGGENETR